MKAADLMAEIPAGRSAVPADILALLILLDGNPLSVRDIRDEFRLPQATTSDLVKRAIDGSWVETEPSPEDKRVNLVFLTGKGLRARASRRGAAATG